MKRLVILFCSACLAMAVTSCTTTAPDSTSGSSIKATRAADKAQRGSIAPYPFTTCAVIRKDLKGNPKHRRVYENQEVLFCCTPCVRAFDTNPEPYMPRIKAGAAAKARGEEVNSGW